MAASYKASAIDSISRAQLVKMLELPGKWCFTTPRMLKMEFVDCANIFSVREYWFAPPAP